MDSLARIVADYPKTTQFRASLAEAQSLLAALLRERQPAKAEPLYRQSVENGMILVAEAPSKPNYPTHLGATLGQWISLLLKQGKQEEAEAIYRECMKFYEKMAAHSSADPAHQQARDETCLRLIWLLIDQVRRPADAETLCRERIALTEKAADSEKTPALLRHKGDLVFALGWALQHQQRFDAAVDVFRQCIAVREKLTAGPAGNPDDRYELLRTHASLGMALASAGQKEAAIEADRRALAAAEQLAADSPREPRYQEQQAVAHLTLGRLLREVGRVAEAEQHEQQAVRFSATLPALVGPANLRLLAWLLATSPDVKQRDPQRAVELARMAVEQRPKRGLFWTTLGAAHYRAGNWQDAIAALEQSMALRQGGNAVDWFFLSMAHWQLGARDEARKWYDRAAERADNNPNNQELGRFRAEASALLGLKDRTLWDEGVKHSRRGIALRDAGRTEEAAEAFRQAIATLEPLVNDFPGPREYRGELGRCYIRLCYATKDAREKSAVLTEALALWQRLAEDFPKNAWVRSDLGEVHALMQEWRKAVDAQTRAIELKVDLWEAWQRRGEAHMNLQEWKAAIADQTKALELNPTYWTTRWRRGNALAALKQWDQALADYDQAIELGATAPRVWVGKAVALTQIKQPDRAVAALREAIAKGFRDGEELQGREDLAPLRERDDFKQLLDELKAKNEK
jgi:tetratricopeptide (TPR) repeat protein